MRLTMMTTRKHYTAAFKAQIVQQVLREEKTLAQIAAEHSAHPNQISQWKATALQGLPTRIADPLRARRRRTGHRESRPG